MATMFYSLSGEGRGHATRVRAIVEDLRKLHQTVIYAPGQAYELLSPVYQGTDVVVRHISGLAFHYTSCHQLNNLKDEMEVAPSQIGQFTTFGEFTEVHLQTLFDEIEKDLANYPLVDCLAKRYYLLGIRNRLLADKGTPKPKCVALNSYLRNA